VSTPPPPAQPAEPAASVAGAGQPDDGLTHLDDRGHARMVEVGGKPATARTAVASCEVHMAPDTAARLLDGALPKGDAVPVVRLAGIQAAKRTHELLPLCHQVALTSVEVDVEVGRDDGVAVITATARAVDRTGVEMEALTAASVAALTLYDLVKAVQRDVVVTQLRLREKRGGRSGDLVLP
jgi:cyclic pyranopterin monophosphate synthase